VQLTAQFQGTAFLERETAGTFELLGPISSGGTVSSGQLLRDTRFRLTVQPPSGQTISAELLVGLTGPGTFRPTGGPVAPRRNGHAASVLSDGRVVIAYGTSADGFSNRSEIFDPVSGTFSLGPPLPSPDGITGATPIKTTGGRFFFVRPSSPGISNPSISVDEFHPAGSVHFPTADGFTASAIGPFGVVWVAAPAPSVLLADGRILIPAKVQQAGLGMRFGVMPYRPETFAFGQFIPHNQQKNFRHVNLLADGRVLFLAADGTSEIFTAGSDAFSTGPSFALARGEFGRAVGLDDGKVLVTGGLVPANAASELYDPASGLVQFGGVPVFGNSLAPHAAKLNAGRVLIVGGPGKEPFGQAQPWAEIFDSTTQSFSATGGVRNSRSSGAAIARLLDGRVLVVGGCDTLPCEAEIYSP
jgi:hypothetical protein